MKSNSNDKVAKWYVIAVVISFVTLVRGPEIIMEILYGSCFTGGLIDYWYLVMHMMGLAFMMIIAIVYYVLRGKYAYGQPLLQREGYILAIVIIALVIAYAASITWVIGYRGPPGRYVI